MLSRRVFLGGLSASLPLLAMPGSLSAQGAAARLHAIVVGINVYTGIGGRGRKVPNLRGCQNDAADIERQVRRFKPETLVRLGWNAAANTDQAVTRAELLRTWEQTLAAARGGDTLLLTFAGHGSRVPVLPGNPSGEADGLDDTLVLTGWNASDGRNAEHIVDDELGEMFAAAGRKGVIVCFVADSCHSGTLTRAVDPLAGDKTYRFVPYEPVATREAVPPGAPPPSVLPNLVFLAGAQESQTVPEILDPSADPPQYRGALSMAFARALAGGAVADGVVTVRSLSVFVRRNVRLLSEGVQTPNVVRPTMVTELGVSDGTPLFVLTAGTPQPPPLPTTPPPGSHTVRLRIQGRGAENAERIVRSLRGAALAVAADAAALEWHAERRLVLNSQGHRIAENVGEGDLQGVVDCRLALDRLIQMAAGGGLDVQVLIGGRDTPVSDAVHKLGDKLGLKVSGLADSGYLAVFNLTGTGLVQMLEPSPTRPHVNTGVPVSGAEKPLPDARVSEPFGADHIVAVAGRQPLTRLMPALLAAHKQPDTDGVMSALASEGQAQPLRIGLRGIYTWRS